MRYSGFLHTFLSITVTSSFFQISARPIDDSVLAEENNTSEWAAYCHGSAVVSGGSAPDLRASAISISNRHLMMSSGKDQNRPLTSHHLNHSQTDESTAALYS